MRNNTEFSLVTINALMHHYLAEGWNVAGQSRIGIYHDTSANTFRIVGRRLDNYEVVANCAINESFTYDKATPSFHQWRDIIDDRVYGLKFTSEQDAQLFSDTIEKIVESSERIARMINGSANNNSTAIMVSNGEHHHHQQPVLNQNGHIGNAAGQTSSSMVTDSSMTMDELTNLQPHITNHQPINSNNNNNCTIKPSSSSSSSPSPTSVSSMPYQITNNNGNNEKSHEDAANVIQGKFGNNNNRIVPTPPPPPPPVPPHLKIAPKPKILAKPESLTNLVAAMNGTPKNYNSNNNNGSNQSNKASTIGNSSQNGLIDEMAQTLARRRAKIEESCGGDSNDSVQNRKPVVGHPPTGPPPPPTTSNTLQIARNFAPVNGHRMIQRTNSISNDNLAKNGTAGRVSIPHNNMVNGRSNSISMSNIANGSINRSTVNGGSSLRGYSPTQIDRLKDEIMDDIRQELAEFKRDLLNALRTEILGNLLQ